MQAGSGQVFYIYLFKFLDAEDRESLSSPPLKLAG
jgi:hypothetical protein